MFCIKCGKEPKMGSKFCTHCGAVLPTADKEPEVKPVASVKVGNKINTSRIIKIAVFLAFISYGAYANRDQTVIETNNNGITNLESGNKDQAISQFQDASQNATSDDNKVNSLKNLAYAYESENKNSDALTTFQKALNLTTNGSFNYYLVSGEINLLQSNPSSALFNFNKAYGIDPNSYQLNNSLAIFYLDLDNSAPAYDNYPKALIYAQKAYSLNNSEISRENLGLANYFNKNYDQAISLLSQTNISQHPSIALWLGYSYASKDDVTNAKIYLQKAVDLGVKVPQEVYDYLKSH